MSVPTTCDEFLNLARKCEVIDPERLEACLCKLRSAGKLPTDPKELGALLVEQGVLTTFQKRQLLRGKYRGFLIGKYRVLERLGSGGMGTVYLAEHVDMRRRVALKVLAGEGTQDPSVIERFRREARAVAALNHPNIVRALDFNQEGELLYLVMDYVEGVSLQELVIRNGPLDFIRAASYIRQAALGLQHAHEAGLVHRDVKPGNILVDRQGVVKLLDLSLARFLHDGGAPITAAYDGGSVLGTADYLAPEQALDSHVDIRADIYSLGATFYFLLVGSAPFAGGNAAQKILWHQTRFPQPIREFRPEVPEQLAALIDTMMAKEPANRFQTPAKLAEALIPWTTASVVPLAEHEIHRISPAAKAAGFRTDRPSAPATAQGGWSQKSDIRSQRSEAEIPALGVGGSISGPGSGFEQASGATSILAQERTRAASNAPELTKPVVASQEVNADRRVAQGSLAAAGPWEGLDRVLPHAGPAVPAGHMKWKTAWLLATAALGSMFVMAALIAVVIWRPFDSRHVANSATANTSRPEPSPEREKPLPSVPGPRSLLVVSRSGEPGTYGSLGAAWAKARSGDRIIIQEEVIEEVLRLDGTAKSIKDVLIQGKAPSGKPVIWRAPTDVEREQALLLVSSVEGIRIEGFRLDGQNRVADLVVLSGRCPSLVLRDIHGEGFLRSAVRMSGCSGTSSQPVSLVRLRTTTTMERESAVILEGARDSGNKHIQVLDSRFEGPYKGGVQLAGPVFDVSILRNRFAKTNAGIWYRRAAPPHPIHLTLTSNTFFQLERGLHFESAPPADPDNQLVVQHNLFLQTKRLAFTDRVPTEPKVVQAQWIWSDEGKGPTPAEDRFFRKGFETTGPAVTRAILNISCDDAFSVWLNGVHVGRSPTRHFTKHAYDFDVTQHLKPGKNVLAVQGTNGVEFISGKTTEAALLVELTSTAGGTMSTLVLSDKSWKVAKKVPTGWQKLEFDDSQWPPVKVLEQYGKGRDGKGSGPWAHVLWDSVVRQHFRGTLPLVPNCTGNFRDLSSMESFPPLDARGANITLPTDPTKDAQYLRYLKTSPLFKAGADQTPVGVPPE